MIPLRELVTVRPVAVLPVANNPTNKYIGTLRHVTLKSELKYYTIIDLILFASKTIFFWEESDFTMYE